jgi:hypothetical protein
MRLPHRVYHTLAGGFRLALRWTSISIQLRFIPPRISPLAVLLRFAVSVKALPAVGFLLLCITAVAAFDNFIAAVTEKTGRGCVPDGGAVAKRTALRLSVERATFACTHRCLCTALR